MSPRLAPLEPPYPAEVQASFDVVMRGAPPILLFRIVARNPRVLGRIMAGGLLDRGSISMRHRELAILRTTALLGAESEWGVHVAAFAAKAGLVESEWRATADGTTTPSFDAADRLVLRLVEALHRSGDVDDALWSDLTARFAADQLVELIMLVGQYHAISFLVNALRIPAETGAPRFRGL